jgi:ankyrin repeat protein
MECIGMTVTLRRSEPLAVALVTAIQAGDLDALRQLLNDHPDVANARIVDDRGGSRTPLHFVTDWPGYYPNGPATVAALIASGADPNARGEGMGHAETPLHWAASSDDIDVAEALIDGGADLEVAGASIANGTALDDAIGYGCWRVARLLVERGARVDKLWHAAALGMLSRMEVFFTEPEQPTREEVNHAFWQACHGGQRRAAEFLAARGADINWMPDYAANKTPLDVGSSVSTGREALLSWLREHGGRSAGRPS